MSKTIGERSGRGSWLAWVSLAGLTMVSNTSAASNHNSSFWEVTVRPGTSVTCMSDPCTVYFEAPAGTGTRDILQNGTIKAGVAIGGQRVSLGHYSNESLVLRLEGTDLPPAYVTVIGGP